MKKNIFSDLTAFLADLEKGKIYYTLAHQRDNAIMVIVTIPGERWEIEFCDDGSVEVERFISDGEIGGKEMLGELLARYSDNDIDEINSIRDNGLEAVAEHHETEQVLNREKIHV
jgi:hypothetical protein